MCAEPNPGARAAPRPRPPGRRPRLRRVASDIVPIQLSLTEGDLVTLWAPRWREDGEEWEAFLGDDDGLFAFPSVPRLAAFVRTDDAHDLGDHPAWPVVADLSVDRKSVV